MRRVLLLGILNLAATHGLLPKPEAVVCAEVIGKISESPAHLWIKSCEKLLRAAPWLKNSQQLETSMNFLFGQYTRVYGYRSNVDFINWLKNHFIDLAAFKDRTLAKLFDLLDAYTQNPNRIRELFFENPEQFFETNYSQLFRAIEIDEQYFGKETTKQKILSHGVFDFSSQRPNKRRDVYALLEELGLTKFEIKKIYLENKRPFARMNPDRLKETVDLVKRQFNYTSNEMTVLLRNGISPFRNADPEILGKTLITIREQFSDEMFWKMRANILRQNAILGALSDLSPDEVHSAFLAVKPYFGLVPNGSQLFQVLFAGQPILMHREYTIGLNLLLNAAREQGMKGEAFVDYVLNGITTSEIETKIARALGDQCPARILKRVLSRKG